MMVSSNIKVVQWTNYYGLQIIAVSKQVLNKISYTTHLMVNMIDVGVHRGVMQDNQPIYNDVNGPGSISVTYAPKALVSLKFSKVDL